MKLLIGTFLCALLLPLNASAHLSQWSYCRRASVASMLTGQSLLRGASPQQTLAYLQRVTKDKPLPRYVLVFVVNMVYKRPSAASLFASPAGEARVMMICLHPQMFGPKHYAPLK